MSLKKRVVKDVLQYTTANYIAMAVGILMSIATKAILGATGAGYWTLLKVFGSYGEYSDLGTRDAMSLELPKAAGAGLTQRAQDIRDSGFSFTVAASLVSMALLAVLALFFVKDPLLQKGLGVAALLVVATQLYNFALTLLRASKKISVLSTTIVVNILLVAALSIAGAFWKGVVGMALGVFAATVLSAFNAYRAGEIRPHWHWNGRMIWELVRTGFPMVVASYAIVTFLTIDSIMIGKMIGFKELGLYAIGLMSVQQISALGRFSQIILVPHIQEKYGRTGVLKDSGMLYVRSTKVLACLLPLIIAYVYFGVPVLVKYFLPKFQEGIPAMKILVLGYFFVAVNEMSPSILFTANKQKKLIPLYALVVPAAAALNYVFIKRGYGIEGVALATSMAYALCFLIVFSYAFRQLLSGPETARLVLSVGLIFVVFSGLALGIDRFSAFNTAVDAVLKCVFFTIVCFPLLYRIEKKEGLLKVFKNIFKSSGREHAGPNLF